MCEILGHLPYLIVVHKKQILQVGTRFCCELCPSNGESSEEYRNIAHVQNLF